jgi:hypothetical protein
MKCWNEQTKQNCQSRILYYRKQQNNSQKGKSFSDKQKLRQHTDSMYTTINVVRSSSGGRNWITSRNSHLYKEMKISESHYNNDKYKSIYCLIFNHFKRQWTK